MRKLVIGDIHGNYKALEHVLEKCSFNPNKDQLITLGDYTDGYPDTPLVLDLLVDLHSLNSLIVPLAGNHDVWLKEYLEYRRVDPLWLKQGGQIVFDHYREGKYPDQYNKHLNFLSNALYYYYVDNDKNVFVHGGYYDQEELSTQDKNNMLWNRDLTDIAAYRNIECIFQGEKFIPKTVFIGHTTTMNWKTTKPIIRNNLVNLDTGAGYNGKLTIMDADTKEYWQSELANTYYPNFKHR